MQFLLRRFRNPTTRALAILARHHVRISVVADPPVSVCFCFERDVRK